MTLCKQDCVVTVYVRIPDDLVAQKAVTHREILRYCL